VVNRSLRLAGDKLNEDIIQYARDKFNLLLGEKTAEEIKIAIGSVIELEAPVEAIMRGRDLVTGLPKEILVNDLQIREAISRSIKNLILNIKATIEETPPELVADIMHQGIVLVGGGSLLRGLPDLISSHTQISVRAEEDPLTTVVRGTGIILENLEALRKVLTLSI
jgi:rod shape-determining protein MreB